MSILKQERGWLVTLLVVILAAGAYYVWQSYNGNELPAGVATGNGRIEAVEIDIAAKTGGRLKDVLVKEGDFVKAGQVLARMDTEQLEARKRQAEAQFEQARIGVDTANLLVTQQQANREAAVAVVAQRNAQFDLAMISLNRSQQLVASNTVSQQVLDDNKANAEGAKAAVSAAQAQLAAADAAINSAKAQVVNAKAAVDAAQAAIDSVDADINDSTLKSPRDGRVQYLVAEPGEVVASGGRVLEIVDLGDVYMTFFLPTAQAGRVAIGADVRLVLDAVPQYVIPAKATYVADVAQFTPKTVETEEERQKLMFRIKARISPELLRKYITQVKTGLPGRAYVLTSPDAKWPDWLQRNVVQ